MLRGDLTDQLAAHVGPVYRVTPTRSRSFRRSPVAITAVDATLWTVTRSPGIPVATSIADGRGIAGHSQPPSKRDPISDTQPRGVRMQPSMFNVRVPLDRARRRVPDEHAYRRAAGRVAAMSPRCSIGSARGDAGTSTAKSATRSTRCVENGFLVEEPRARSPRRSNEYLHRRQERHRAAARHGADDAAVQLRLRLLLPGRPRRLQQVRREDVARDRRARSATGSSASSTRCSPRSSC